MRKTMLAAFIAAGMLFTSCSDNDDTTPQREETKVLPSKSVAKTTYEDGSYDEFITTFQYDSQDRLVKLVEDDKEDDSYTSTTEYSFEYSGDELTKVIESYSSSAISETQTTEYSFSKNGNKVTVTEKDEYGEDSYVFDINEKGYLLSSEYDTYSYDEKGNLVKEGDEYEQVVYEYDNKNGVVKNLNVPQWVLSGIVYSYAEMYVNNAVKYKYEYFDDSDANSEMTITYQYNADGYPVSGIAESTDEDGTYSITIEYK